MKHLDIPEQDLPLNVAPRPELRARTVELLESESNRTNAEVLVIILNALEPVSIRTEPLKEYYRKAQDIRTHESNRTRRLIKLEALRKEWWDIPVMHRKTYSDVLSHSGILETNEDHSPLLH